MGLGQHTSKVAQTPSTLAMTRTLSWVYGAILVIVGQIVNDDLVQRYAILFLRTACMATERVRITP